MPVMDIALVEALLRDGDSPQKNLSIPAKFQVGDTVRAKVINPPGHTRLPRYVRGHLGQIVRDHGVYPFPDTAFAGDERPQHVYVVEFRARDLWGADAGEKDTLRVDLWDDHLEPGPENRQ